MTGDSGTVVLFSFLLTIVIIGLASATIFHRMKKNKKSKKFDGDEIVVEKQDELPKNK